MKAQKNFVHCIKIILGFILLFPISAYAHLISITATKPFPTSIAATLSATAIFTVKNTTSKVTVTVVDKSSFPSGSGLFISSSTCGSLGPGQSCTIQVTLNANVPGQIATELKEWAKPSADGVQFPINITVTPGLPSISIVPVASSKSKINPLPALRSPIVGINGSSWLIVSGSLGAFHDFNHNFNTAIYVYKPSTGQVYSVNIASTNLPTPVVNQLASMNPENLQEGDTLYILGGYYNVPNTNVYTTLQTITAINVPGMMSAVMAGQTNLAQYVTYNTSIPQFQVTGGQLGKIGNYFYLAYGQDCEGLYCANSQTYTNAIYQFTADPTLSSISIVNTVKHLDLDNTGWRRRDYTLAPFMLNNNQSLLAVGGPFTPGSNALVWTNGINFNGNLQYNNNFITSQANQYDSPHLSMYSVSRNVTFLATFSGLSNLYYAANGNLTYNNLTPYGNILDLIGSDASGNVQEYANVQPMCSGQPLASCLYMGLTAEFIPVLPNYYDNRYVLQLDQMPSNAPTLVGYLFGGLLSSSQDVFGTGASYPTNQIYAVYVVPAGTGAVGWRVITNAFA